MAAQPDGVPSDQTIWDVLRLLFVKDKKDVDQSWPSDPKDDRDGLDDPRAKKDKKGP